MGFMDKFKNLFTDEEIVEEEVNEPIEIKKVKKEEEVNKLPTFMRQRLDDEVLDDLKKSDNKIDFNMDDDLKIEAISFDGDNKDKKDNFSVGLEEKNSFKFPLEFNDDDFIETRSRHKEHSKKNHEDKEFDNFREVSKDPLKKRVEMETSKKDVTKVSELYKEKKQEEKKFKATPIISPIYGILNKNYNSDDVACTDDNSLEHKRHSKSVDFDSVRKKAYGDLSKEIKENLMCENCEYLKEAKECKRLKEAEVEKNMVYEALNEADDMEYSDITLDEATENYYDYGVSYEKKKVNKDDLIKLDDVVINNHEEVDSDNKRGKRTPPPVKSDINLLSTGGKSVLSDNDNDLELTDDLFSLIDSMYDERND